MANLRVLVKRRKAVRNIRKITKTMELIATARFKKAFDRASEAAAYTKKIAELAAARAAALRAQRDAVVEHYEAYQTQNPDIALGHWYGAVERVESVSLLRRDGLEQPCASIGQLFV